MNAARKTKNVCRGALPRRLDELAARGGLPELLDRLPDERLRTLLLYRHGLALSWPAIRDAAERHGLYYSERHLYRLYAQALALAAGYLEAAHEN